MQSVLNTWMWIHFIKKKKKEIKKIFNKKAEKDYELDAEW